MLLDEKHDTPHYYSFMNILPLKKPNEWNYKLFALFFFFILVIIFQRVDYLQWLQNWQKIPGIYCKLLGLYDIKSKALFA